jgi:hypothetical protein
MDKYTKAVLALVFISIGAWVYLAPQYKYYRHPPYIGHYANIAGWGEFYLTWIDSRPPAYAVIYAPVRNYE